MARSSMASLITQVRLMVADPYGSTAVMTDDQVQACLDQHRNDERYVQMRPVDRIAAGGAVTYVEFWAPASMTWWESDAALVDGSFNTVTPTTSDYVNGRWVFAADQSSVMPLHLSGQWYDVYGAAADACQVIAASVSLQMDYADAGIQNTWQFKQKNMIDLEMQYRRRQRTVSGQQRRQDAACTP